MGIGTVALRAIGRQGWLPGRVRLIRALASGAGREFEADFFGLRFSGNTSAWIDWSVYYLGAYAAEELQLLSDIVARLRPLRETVTVYDVGANVGNHTLRLSLVADRVIAFEPDPVNGARLARHVERNRLANVQVFDCALGERSGEARIANFMEGNHGAAQVVSAGGQAIRMERGDDLVARHALPRIDVLKIDVEGAERDVLRGLRQTLVRDRPVILFEVLAAAQPQYTPAAFAELLYPDCTLFSVLARRASLKRLYRVLPLDLQRSEEVLCVPNELISVLKPVLGTPRPAAG